MAKITRKSYKRKKIVLGATLFASIALISTGFAAWVISQDATNKPEGTIGIGKVKDGAVDFVGVKQSTNKFVFDCKADDKDGRVYFEEDETNKGGELLSVTISGYIKQPKYFESLTVSMTVPESIKTAANEEHKYIVLPACATTTQTITPEEITYKVLESDAELIEEGCTVGEELLPFSYEIKFTWGEAFKTLNPGIYFDDEASGGKAVALTEVKRIMNDLKTVLADGGNYTVTLKATAK